MEDSESEHETGCDEQELIEPHGSALGKGMVNVDFMIVY